MNFFDQYPEFISADPRKDRGLTQVNSESMSKRCEVTLPAWLIKDKTILDLGSCFGAYGHWALIKGAKHYTGVEIHKEFSEPSKELLGKYHKDFTIHQADALEFLKTNTQKYDIIVAAGVIHGYTDVIELLKLIAGTANECVLVESLELEEKIYPKIEFKPYRMVMPKKEGFSNYRYSEGLTPIVGIKALSFIMNEYGFSIDGGRIKPEKITGSIDIYNTPIDDVKTSINVNPLDITPNRYICRFFKEETTKGSLQNQIDTNSSVSLDKTWKFDNSVARRFQHEARTNIPDYDRVVELCLNLANKKFKKTARVIDVGSALGYTIDVFCNDGYTTVMGVDNSQDMIKNSKHKNRITLSDKLPTDSYDIILANWTLHFVDVRKEYLQDVYNYMSPSGMFILSEKTCQTDVIKELYYDFKRSNGVTDEYIYEKEQKLKGYMNLLPAEWYIDTMKEIGFKNIQIINSRLGFVTFYAEK